MKTNVAPVALSAINNAWHLIIFWCCATILGIFAYCPHGVMVVRLRGHNLLWFYNLSNSHIPTPVQFLFFDSLRRWQMLRMATYTRRGFVEQIKRWISGFWCLNIESEIRLLFWGQQSFIVYICALHQWFSLSVELHHPFEITDILATNSRNAHISTDLPTKHMFAI